MARIIVLLGLLVLLALPLSAGVTSASTADPQAFAVIAHRGASRLAPENTLRAVRAAVRADSDVVEVDVRLTSDDRVVLMHDPTLTRTTDARARYPHRHPWRVGDFTLAELRELDAGAWKDERFAGLRVPTLRQALAAVEGKAALLIELKGSQAGAGMEERVAEHLTSDGTPTGPLDPRHDVAVQAFDPAAVARFAALQPDVPVTVLTRRAPTAAMLDRYRRFADGVAPPQRSVDPSVIAAAQRRGLRITPYTVNDRPTMRRLISWGVDGLISDAPRRLDEVRDAMP